MVSAKAWCLRGSYLKSLTALTYWSLGDLMADFKNAIFSLVSLTGTVVPSDLLMIMPSHKCLKTLLLLIDNKSTLVQVIFLCCQVTGHYLYANVDPDLCHHMPSLDQNELIKTMLIIC